MKTSLLLILFVGLLLNCGNQEDAILPAKGSISLDFEPGQEKTLVIKGAPDKELNIKLTSVKDERCTGSQCQTCYGGYLYAYFDVWNSTTHDSLTLSRISCVEIANLTFDNPVIDRKDLKGLRIGLAAISGNLDNKSNYKIQLLIADL